MPLTPPTVQEYEVSKDYRHATKALFPSILDSDGLERMFEADTSVGPAYLTINVLYSDGIGPSGGGVDYIRNGVNTTPEVDTGDATQNRPIPMLALQGEQLAPLPMGNGNPATALRVFANIYLEGTDIDLTNPVPVDIYPGGVLYTKLTTLLNAFGM